MAPISCRNGRPRLALVVATLALMLGPAVACGVLPSNEPPTVGPTVAPAAQTAPTAPPTVATSPTAAPDPGPAPAFADVAAASAAYASLVHGDPDAIAQALRSWGMAPQPSPELAALAQQQAVVAADLDGDGQDEVVVLASNPEPQFIAGEGTLMVLNATDGGYSVGYDSIAAGDSQGSVAVLAVQDATGDGLADVAFAVESCGAHTCMADVRVLSYQEGAYRQLADSISSAYPDRIVLEDRNSDGVQEIVVHGNVIGSVGAGPQRASTMTYSLVEGRYRLTGVEYDPSDLLYFRVVDGNLALSQGFINEAIAIYTEAVQNQSLQTSGVLATPEEERAALISFARFRLIVAYAIQEEAFTGRELALMRAEAGPFLPAAEAFWEAYAE